MDPRKNKSFEFKGFNGLEERGHGEENMSGRNKCHANIKFLRVLVNGITSEKRQIILLVKLIRNKNIIFHSIQFIQMRCFVNAPENYRVTVSINNICININLTTDQVQVVIYVQNIQQTKYYAVYSWKVPRFEITFFFIKYQCANKHREKKYVRFLGVYYNII